MTNSIASAKCPSSVLTSGNYGMSQNRYTDDSKEYIFVKLTDSAYRAIEEYQHNANSRRFLHGQCAKIKFVGNSGIIHFPTTTTTTTTNDNSIHNSNNNKKNNNNGGGRQFGFAIDEVEGSLECLQQRQHDLDVLGSLSYRMRIHANEDVYDTTRTKMAIAEETEKSKCIREIKPNQTDIGRKVKKQPLTTSYSSHQQQQHHGVNNIALGGGGAGGAGGIGNNSHNHHHHHSQTTNTSSNFSNSLNRIKGASPNRNSSSSVGNNHNTKSGNSSSNVKMGATASVQQRLSPNPAMIGGSGTIGSTTSINRYGNNSSNHQNNSHHSSTTAAAATATATMASSLSSAFANGIVNGYASATSANAISGTNSKRLKPGIAGTNSSNSREGNSTSSIGGGDNLKAAPKSLFGSVNNIVSGVIAVSGGKNSNSSNNNKLPDISRRKIRERLIHLLALKPFKKPELYARLQNEGIRERERPLISNILKDISTMSRDNTYNLRRQMWNDVNENWPYYTEQELQLLKRRKPQNLTPPLSSDAGSSTSGQSPTSTHTGSPPPIVSNSLAESGGGGGSSSKSLKRNSLDYDDTLLSSVQVKKQRISHYRKDAMASTTRTAPIGNAGSGSGSYGSANSRSVLAKNNTTSYSPSRQQASGIMHGNSDEHFGGVGGGETDLSYNVLDNADDFMSHLERDNGSQGSRKAGKKTGNFNSNSNSTNLKTSSPKYRKSYAKMSDNSTTSTTTSAAVSFGGSFVPENKSTTNCQNQASANHRNSQHFQQQQQQQQRQSPSYAQQPNHKNTNTSTVGGNKSSSSIHSVRTLSTPSAMLHDDAALTQQNRTGTGLVINSNISSSSSSINCFQHKSTRAPTPPMRGSSSNSNSANNGDGYNHRQQNVAKHSTKASPETEPQHQHQHQQQHAHHQPVASSSTLQQQTQQQQQHSSPTQQLADAATAYASAYSSTVSPTDKPHYDFSNYTPITTIEQRRKYKTEFESDYDEYLKLLEQIEGVGKRFRGLAARLESARKGCPEFNAIKQQIVSEYERIRNAETLKRDKQRFDYLHEKLAYIKQLVTDYDKTLTSGSGNGNGVTPAVISATTSSWSSLMPSPKHQQQNDIATTTTTLQPTTTALEQNSKQQQLQHYGYQQQTQKQQQQLQQQHPHHQQQQLQLNNQPHSQQRSAMFTTSLTHQIGKETSTDENCGQIKSNKYQYHQQQQSAMQHGQQYQRSHHHRYMSNQNDTNNSDCSSDSNDDSEDDDFNNSQSVIFPNGNANHYEQLLHEVVDDDAHVSHDDDSDHDDGDDDANVDDSYSNNSNDHDNQNSELF